ncbi:MAG: DNA sulfur modification protein DndD [Gallionella sp.]|nr:DNA sulfur modification protein DndD [Gallionella sp.]
MWLSRIELKNFKSYRQQIFDFPKPQNGQNLVLIGGVNGYGKTTLLEAIYVGLYGEEAVNHKALDRAGLKAKSYGHFLETALYRLAAHAGEARMEVGIEFTRDDETALRITRRWFFKSNGKYDDQKIIVETRSNANSWMPHKEDELPELFGSYVTPPWLAPFFFFDGEKISSLADEDRNGWVTSGLESLLGVVLVKELREQLASYSRKKITQGGGTDENRVNELGLTREENIRQMERLTQELTDIRYQLSEERDKRERLTSCLTDLAQGGDARTVAEVAEAGSRAEQAERETREKLRKLFSSTLPLQLIRPALYNSLTRSLEAEKQLTDWEQSVSTLLPKWQKFHDTFFESEWIKVVSQFPNAHDSLEKTLRQAWDSINHPRPECCAEAIWHDYLQLQEQHKLEQMREKFKLSATELRQAEQDSTHAEQEKKRLRRELTRLEGMDGENKVAEIKALTLQLESAYEKVDTLSRKEIAKANEHKALSKEVAAQTATYERERKELADKHPERDAAREAERVIAMIDDLLQPLFKLKLQALSKAATEIFRGLHHKNQIASIEVAVDGRATVRSHEGTEITLAKSSGESQLFVLALVGALAEVTGYCVPLIVDTPLARLSKQHCDNLLGYWTKDTSRQVILLVQDKEIGNDEYQKLKSRISKTYLLQHQQLKHGVGQTEAIADHYFGGVQ